MVSADMTGGTPIPMTGRWRTRWEPEDERFRQREGRFVGRRGVLLSVRMMPAVLANEAGRAIAAGENGTVALACARKLHGSLIGDAGSAEAPGGVGVDLACRAAYGPARTGTTASAVFTGYYTGGPAGTGRVCWRPHEDTVSGRESARAKAVGQV